MKLRSQEQDVKAEHLASTSLTSCSCLGGVGGGGRAAPHFSCFLRMAKVAEEYKHKATETSTQTCERPPGVWNHSDMNRFRIRGNNNICPSIVFPLMRNQIDQNVKYLGQNSTNVDLKRGKLCFGCFQCGWSEFKPGRVLFSRSRQRLR